MQNKENLQHAVHQTGRLHGRKRGLRQFLSLLLCAAMLVTLMPETLAGVFGGAAKVKAAGAIYVNDKADGSGENKLATEVLEGDGWSYDEASNTLTLEDFNGSYIETDAALTIYLKGTNILTMSEEMDVNAGIYADNNRVTIEAASSADTLKVQADFTEKRPIGLYANLVVNGGTLIVDCKSAANVAYGNVYGVTVNNDAVLSMTVEGSSEEKNARSEGMPTLYAQTSGTIDISVTGGRGHCVRDLIATGRGAVTLTASEGVYTLYNRLQIGSSAGDVTLNGKALIVFNQYNETFNISNNKVITNHKDGYYWYKKSGDDSYMWDEQHYLLVDKDGNAITDAKFVTETVPLTVGKKEYTITGLKVGTSYNSYSTPDGTGLMLKWATYGGAGTYRYTLKEGSSLPTGLTLYSTYGYILGTPKEATEAGTAIILVTDSAGASEEVTVHYAKVDVDAPVNSVSVAPTAVQIAAGETAQLSATVLPADATITDVIFASKDTAVAAVDSETLSKTENVSKITVKGVAPGKTTVTATTKQGKLTSSSAVTVIEATPAAVHGTDETGLYLTGLVAGAAYTVDGTE